MKINDLAMACRKKQSKVSGLTRAPYMLYIIMMLSIILITLAVNSENSYAEAESIGLCLEVVEKDTSENSSTNLTFDDAQAAPPLNSSVQISDLCNVTISLRLLKKEYNSSERIVYWNELSKSMEGFSIDYWVEDTEGNIVRKKKTTANLLSKSMSFSTAETTEYIIRNSLAVPGCEDRGSYHSQKIIVVIKDPEKEKKSSDSAAGSLKNTTSTKTAAKQKPALALVSFYTRARNPNEKINVFARVEGKGEGMLRISGPKADIEERIISDGSVKKEYEVMLQNGENKLTAELLQDGSEVQQISFFFNGTGTEEMNFSEEKEGNATGKLNGNDIDYSERLSKTAGTSKSATEHESEKSSSGSETEDRENSMTGEVVFESSEAKQKSRIVLLLLVTVSLVSAFLVMKKIR